MIKSEHGIVNLKVPDFEKVLGISPAKARINEEAHFYADLSAILDALADQYGHSTVWNMMERYLDEKIKELNNE